MGPHFFKCGKKSNPLCSMDCGKGFNGAALFQVRKVFADLYLRNGKFSASMGPHFFKCGKLCEEWRLDSPRSRFNGAALFQVRKAPLKPLHWLQWGRTFSSAESKHFDFK